MSDEHEQLPAKTTVDVSKMQQALTAVTEPTSGLDMMTLATVMAQSGMFPDIKSASQGVVKILAGRELGFPPIASLRHIYMQNGHIGVQATLIASKIRSSGRYDYKVLTSNDETCEIEITRKNGTGWVSLGVVSFTMAEAKRAKLVRERGSYETYPPDMLFARAISRAQRRHCPDLFAQTVYSLEDLKSMREEGLDGPEGNPVPDMMPREKVDPGADAHETDRATGEAMEDHEAAGGGVDPGAASAAAGAPVAADVAPSAETSRESEPPKEPSKSGDEPGRAPTPPPAKGTTFEINGVAYHTAGITKEQLMGTLRKAPKVDAKHGKGYAAKLLLTEFEVQTRVDLTSEQAEQYLVRLDEILSA